MSAQEREKYWQEKAGRMASIANFMYQLLDDRKLSETEVEQTKDMFAEVMEVIEFDEGLYGDL